MEYSAAQTQRTETLYHTAGASWLEGSYCVVHSVEQQHRLVTSASEHNVASSTLRERFQPTRNVGSDGHLKTNRDQGHGQECRNENSNAANEHKKSGLFVKMQRKMSSNFEHYGGKLFNFAANNVFSREHGSQVRPRKNIGNDDFEVIEKHELAKLPDFYDMGIATDVQSDLTHGHRFVPVNLKAPNWCDKCGEFIWGWIKHCYICINCRYTCHLKCRHLVTLDCIVKAASENVNEEETCFYDEDSDLDDDDSGYFTCQSTVRRSFNTYDRRCGLMWTKEKLDRRIAEFNQNNHGLQIDLIDGSDMFQGSIRVHINLIRPINMSLSPSLPSLYNTLTHETEQNVTQETSPKVMSFYLPKNTSKVIHVYSKTTVQEVIRALLSKYNITDNPRKFALYEKTLGNRKTGVMRKMAEDELPLAICLSWTDGGADQLDNNMFILQENDTGEIMWEAFSLPELESFLAVLNREEEEHVEQVKEKYRLYRIQLQKEAKQREQGRTNGKRAPVFV